MSDPKDDAIKRLQQIYDESVASNQYGPDTLHVLKYLCHGIDQPDQIKWTPKDLKFLKNTRIKP